MKVKFLLLVLVLCGSFSAYGQDKFLKGRVVNEASGEAVPFANVILQGTAYGTSSDQHGIFTLRITDMMKTEALKVTAVGYSTAFLNVGAASASGDTCVVRLKPVVYNIKDVDVFGKSMKYRKMLREVLENISRNYVTVPYNYIGYFIEKDGDITKGGRFREAEVVVYNAEGYRRVDPVTAYRNENYRFRQVRRNFEPSGVFESLTSMDDVLALDVVKNFRNILDTNAVPAYVLQNLGEIDVNGRRVQTIGFKVTDPEPRNTGVEKVTAFSGKIYIDVKNFAVLQYSASVDFTGKSYLGFNFLKGDGSDRPGHVDFLVTYKPYGGKYVLSGVSIVGSGKEVQFITTGLVTEHPEKISTRTYCEDQETDPEFWKTYSVSGI